MIFISNNQNLSASSGIINMSFLENIYHSVMDEMMLDLGRVVTFHLPPIVQQDTTTQAKLPAQQYNPFFSRVPVPNTNTRNTGTKVTHRDVQYNAQIVVGPLDRSDDNDGIGNLRENEAMITVVIEALPHVQEAQSCTIEGRRYGIVTEPRPIGFSTRRYLMVKLKEIQEIESPNPDITIG